MLYFVVGMPGPFAELCEALALALVRSSQGVAEAAEASLLAEIARAALASPAPRLVVAGRHPGGRVRAALAQSRRPLVVVRGDPRRGLFHLVERRGVAFAAALRAVAGSCASLPPFAALPRALVLDPERDGADPRHLAAALARHLELGLDEPAAAECAAGLGATDSAGEAADAEAWWAALDPALQALAEGALARYLADPPGLSAAPRPLPFVWGRELFFAGAPPGAPAPAEIDITGRARRLLHGPGILLPAGRWLVTMTLDLSPDAAEHALVLAATTGAVAARTQIRPAAPGPVDAALALDLPDLPDRPLDLTLATQRPAFAGLVALRHVTAAPHPPAEPC
jgi:hypothetical protein